MDEENLYRRLDIDGLKTEKQRSLGRGISEAVFDKESLMSLYELEKKGAFTDLKGIISTGKEASVFHAMSGKKEVAIKIFLVETSDFRNMTRYIRGDPRFSGWKNHRQLIYLWASKEFKNLSRVSESVDCPKPIAVEKNVLVMEFLGKAGKCAPRLKDAQIKDPQRYYDQTIEQIRRLYKLRIVHADLSEYNVLDWKKKPYLIDFSAGVLLDHPEAIEFLQRDLQNITHFFKKLGADADYSKALKAVMDDN